MVADNDSENNKFIMLGLGDENSKEVAEILGNKTCKAIIDYLGDVKEVSEKDLSKALGIPLNTTEYNLKKLVKVGLVVKSKNFFWSTRGKKIVMYKLAKKHIIIGSKKPNINVLRSLIPVLAVVIALSLIVLSMNLIPEKESGDNSYIKQFSSEAEFQSFLEDNQLDESYSYGAGFGGGLRTFTDGFNQELALASEAGAKIAGDSGSASDYSDTNIQVQGVDEADIVKNDGKYIYYVVEGSLYILEAYPAEDMRILSQINVSNIRGIFLNNNEEQLIVFSNTYDGETKALINVFDIRNKEEPSLAENYILEGGYLDSRMIGDEVYVITNKYVDLNMPDLPVYTIQGVERKVIMEDVYYFDNPDYSFMFTNVMKLDLSENEVEVNAFLGGRANQIYMSENNLYLTYFKQEVEEDYLESFCREVYSPLVSEDIKDQIKEVLDEDISDWKKTNDIQKLVYNYFEEKGDADKIMELAEKISEFQGNRGKLIEKTVITRIDLDDLEVEASGKVPGRILNQFAMHEQGNKFFIATTTGDSWRSRDNSLNHLYSLDNDLEVIGSVEDLAKGERIYSVRFMQDRAYIVTFRRTDPLYVIDISDADDLEVLGYLKITGFSNYLHPYDEDHLIGIGQEADENGRVQGLKVSLFDVSDVEHPIEVAKYIIDGWSSSSAQYDHKAVLFDKSRNMLVMPVTSSIKHCTTNNVCGYERFQGAYVFDVTEDEIDLKGMIEHIDDNADVNNEDKYYWSSYNYAIQRTLFMDDVLYSLSNAIVLASDLQSLTLDEINSVDLPLIHGDYYGRYDGLVILE
jgi:inhibitor of cysteine peptidase